MNEKLNPYQSPVSAKLLARARPVKSLNLGFSSLTMILGWVVWILGCPYPMTNMFVSGFCGSLFWLVQRQTVVGAFSVGFGFALAALALGLLKSGVIPVGDWTQLAAIFFMIVYAAPGVVVGVAISSLLGRRSGRGPLR